MVQRITKTNISIRFILLALFALIPIFQLSAADGDTFEVDGIKYTVISEAEKTCRTKAGFWGNAFTSPNSGNVVSGEITLPSDPKGYTLVEIGNCCFLNNRSLKSIIIPSTVKTIGTRAFQGCSELSTLTIPASVEKFGTFPLYECNITPLIFEGTYRTLPNSDIFVGLRGVVLCNTKSLPVFKAAKTGYFSVYSYDNPFNITYTPTYTGCKVIVKDNQYFSLGSHSDYKIEFDTITYDENEKQIATPLLTLSKVEPGEYTVTGASMGSNIEVTVTWTADGSEYTDNFTFTTKKGDLISGISSSSTSTSITINKINYTNDSTLNISEVGVYYNDKKYTFKDSLIFDDLKIGTDYSFIPYLLYNNGEDEYKGEARRVYTQHINLELIYSTTQTSITIRGLSISDATGIKNVKKGVEYLNKEYEITDKIIFEDLCPDNNYYLEPYIVYGNQQQYKYKDGKQCTTNGWDIQFNAVVGPTSLEPKATFKSSNTVKPAECYWKLATQEYPGEQILLTGLTPSSEYLVAFYWTYESPTHEKKTYSTLSYRYPPKWTTSSLTLKTLAPKCVSSTCAIVAAETNISDVEPSVGFQWKKYDAPASLAPNEGYGAVCDGVVEGYIKNLQSNFYYNVRAFYKDGAGRYYYSDWVTFDPSDFSFFEPTVRTYPVQEVGENMASVRGYALAGTENIKSQGFQYWVTSSPSNTRMYAPGNSEITTIVANGQVMTATFENLLPGTSYTYRAFVETDAGFTFGDEQKFTTNESQSSYIETIVDEDTAPVIIGYYDLSGRRYNVMQSGLNIIVYSDGTTKKVMNR